MKNLKQKIIVITIFIVAVLLIVFIARSSSTKTKSENIYVKPKFGEFSVVVYTTGELQAKNSIDIYGPQLTQNRNIRVAEIKITDLVQEGTEVKKGDYVATLDRTTFDNTLKDEISTLETYTANLEVKILDTAVSLSNLRDNIKNLKFSVEEAKITLQQSKYEPPSVIRQAEISLDKANRTLRENIKNYELKLEQAKIDIGNIQKNLNNQNKKVSDLEDIISKFIITAPSDGMVIYKKDRSGNKVIIGSSISPWDNVVATLPDMSVMISKTYVNEIDINKIKVGQPVVVGVDAFTNRFYDGTVISVSNVGEQLPNTNAKVFEVLVEIKESNFALKPAMTTGNKIIVKTISNVLYIPIHLVQYDLDSVPFVYLKNNKKQIIKIGEYNENDIVVEDGLNTESILLQSNI